ncbi:ankyrin repeat-containing protein BDA1-like [Rhododendron vialii]|uniref:ankyrin repeat-containing protein BDA1-like n=1 Tax=Rhododendron vialii TaxID=182163 RepID=UPI00265F54A0|nr:ankyrin repeat-containing protein BDA1-like [Rhododendron vialii]
MEELLCDAAMRGDLALLYDIIARDVYILDRVLVGSLKGKNPLHVAISTGKTEFVLQLLKIKPDLAGVLDMELGAALHVASAKGHIEIVKALVKVSPEMSLARDRDGNNPLHIAAIKGQDQVLQELVRTSPHRAQVKVDRGDTILHLCVKYDQLECLQLLLDMIPYPDFVNDVDAGGNNILHLAVLEKRSEILSFISLKVRVKMVNKERNPSDTEIQDILIEAGAKRREPASVVEIERLEPSWQTKRRNTLMIVASLIATMAFQVGVNPLGGVWLDNLEGPGGHVAGKAITAYNSPYQYRGFMYLNTVGFLVSLSTIVMLIFALPEPKKALRLARAAISWFTIITTACTYTFSVLAISPADDYQVNHALKIITILWAAASLLFQPGSIRLMGFTQEVQNLMKRIRLYL